MLLGSPPCIMATWDDLNKRTAMNIKLTKLELIEISSLIVRVLALL